METFGASSSNPRQPDNCQEDELWRTRQPLHPFLGRAGHKFGVSARPPGIPKWGRYDLAVPTQLQEVRRRPAQPGSPKVTVSPSRSLVFLDLPPPSWKLGRWEKLNKARLGPELTYGGLSSRLPPPPWSRVVAGGPYPPCGSDGGGDKQPDNIPSLTY